MGWNQPRSIGKRRMSRPPPRRRRDARPPCRRADRIDATARSETAQKPRLTETSSVKGRRTPRVRLQVVIERNDNQSHVMSFYKVSDNIMLHPTINRDDGRLVAALVVRPDTFGRNFRHEIPQIRIDETDLGRRTRRRPFHFQPPEDRPALP